MYNKAGLRSVWAPSPPGGVGPLIPTVTFLSVSHSFVASCFQEPVLSSWTDMCVIFLITKIGGGGGGSCRKRTTTLYKCIYVEVVYTRKIFQSENEFSS